MVPKNWFLALVCNEKREIAAKRLSKGNESSFNTSKAFVEFVLVDHKVVVSVHNNESV